MSEINDAHRDTPVAVSPTTTVATRGGSENNQDHVFTMDHPRYHLAAVFDGHGNDDCINQIRSICTQNSEVFLSDDPICRIFNLTMGCEGGSTANIIRVSKECIENFHVGDSMCWIIDITDVPHILHRSTPHLPSDITERKRLVQRREEQPCFDFEVVYSRQQLFDIVSKHTVQFRRERGSYVQFTQGPLQRLLTPTQVLGHRGITGCSPGRTTVTRHPRHSYLCITVSDGVTEIMDIKNFHNLAIRCGGASAIVALAYQRWNQEWSILSDRGKPLGTQKFDTMDDISATYTLVPPLGVH